MAGLQQGTRRFLYACTDIEGHSGLDSRHYVLDFARVFPPTYSPAVQHTFLYQLMRPEVRRKKEREERKRGREEEERRREEDRKRGRREKGRAENWKQTQVYLFVCDVFFGYSL